MELVAYIVYEHVRLHNYLNIAAAVPDRVA